MNYKKTFEDKGFIYELTIHPASEIPENDLHVYTQEQGYYCHWSITGKRNQLTRDLTVTDDNCEVIVYNTVEAAVSGAREFLSI